MGNRSNSQDTVNATNTRVDALCACEGEDINSCRRSQKSTLNSNSVIHKMPIVKAYLNLSPIRESGIVGFAILCVCVCWVCSFIKHLNPTHHWTSSEFYTKNFICTKERALQQHIRGNYQYNGDGIHIHEKLMETERKYYDRRFRNVTHENNKKK